MQKAIITTDKGSKYTIENIIGMTYYAGTLAIIYTEAGETRSTMYSEDSLQKGYINIVTE